jgi:glycosyltransferase involved in cell wall biosynthesis
MRLLQVTGTLDPEYGGPPVVLNRITADLTALGHDIEVATLDSPEAPWMHEFVGSARAFGPGTGNYRYARRFGQWLQHHAAEYDAVLVHGIWQYQSLATRHACINANVPYFVFVHGALDPWFEQRYPAKHAKKSLYWRLFEHRVLRDARSVLFTRDEECLLARTSFSPYRVAEAVIDIGVEAPDGDAVAQRGVFLAAFPELRDKRVVLFLSRIHPKKGCDLLIRAFAEFGQRDPDLRLVIAGPGDDATKTTLEALAASVGVAHRITWTGMLSGDLKWGAFHAADVFALTSHSENFGVVVPEALACGLPVLITDKVNIWRDIDRWGAGFVEPDTAEGAVALLRRWLALTARERQAMRLRARECFSATFDTRSAAAELAGLLSQAMR